MVLFALCLLILDQGQFESYLEMTNFMEAVFYIAYSWSANSGRGNKLSIYDMILKICDGWLIGEQDMLIAKSKI